MFNLNLYKRTIRINEQFNTRVILFSELNDKNNKIEIIVLKGFIKE